MRTNSDTPVILVLQGIPASGKSTWAREFVNQNPDWIIVNRDDIRRMFGKYWMPNRERLVERVESDIIYTAITSNWNVIIDDTNLNPKTIKKWMAVAEILDVKIEFQKFDISLEEALQRDKNRSNPVGEEVIVRFYNKYCNPNKTN